MRLTPVDTADTLRRELWTDRGLRKQAEDARPFCIFLGPADEDAPGFTQSIRNFGLLTELGHLDVEHRECVLDQRDIEVFLDRKYR